MSIRLGCQKVKDSVLTYYVNTSFTDTVNGSWKYDRCVHISRTLIVYEEMAFNEGYAGDDSLHKHREEQSTSLPNVAFA